MSWFLFKIILCDFSELPKSLEDSIANRYGPEALSEIQNFKGKDLKISFSYDKVKWHSMNKWEFKSFLFCSSNKLE